MWRCRSNKKWKRVARTETQQFSSFFPRWCVEIVRNKRTRNKGEEAAFRENQPRACVCVGEFKGLLILRAKFRQARWKFPINNWRGEPSNDSSAEFRKTIRQNLEPRASVLVWKQFSFSSPASRCACVLVMIHVFCCCCKCSRDKIDKLGRGCCFPFPDDRPGSTPVEAPMWYWWTFCVVTLWSLPGVA